MTIRAAPQKNSTLNKKLDPLTDGLDYHFVGMCGCNFVHT
jgi:hypothetical protein